MKLNHDCVRHILMVVEERPYTVNGLQNSDFANHDLTKNYSDGEIAYTVTILIEAGFLVGESETDMRGTFNISVDRLTFKGHEFVGSIKDDSLWKETKKAASKVKGLSLDTVSKTATALIGKMLADYLQTY